MLWTLRLGARVTAVANAVAVAPDGSIYVAGNILDGNSITRDVFVTKYESDGEKRWIRRLGSKIQDWGSDLVVDKDENIYVVGYTDGAFPNQVNLGDQDAFLLKINANGELVWTRQFGSIEGDFAFGVALDQRGSVYVAGVTTRDLQEQTNARNQDVFVRVFGPNGGERLNQHLGTDLDDHVRYFREYLYFRLD